MREIYIVIPKNANFFKQTFQCLAQDIIIAHIVCRNAEQFIHDVMLIEYVEYNVCHVLSSMMIKESFECQYFLIKLEIDINSVSDDFYKKFMEFIRKLHARE